MALLLHTRIRVSDLDQSIKFYEGLGFEVEGRTDRSPAGNHLAFLGLPGNDHKLELCWSEDYELNVPEDLMHICIGVKDLTAFCEELEEKGYEIWPDNWREAFAKGSKMAFVTDPDNYEIELVERRNA